MENESTDNFSCQAGLQEKIVNVQRTIDDLMAQIEELAPNASSEISMVKNPEIVMRFGNKRGTYKLPMAAKFKEVKQIAHVTFPSNNKFIGIKDENSQFIWIRNSRDLHCAFAGLSEFSNNNILHFIGFDKKTMGPVADLDLSEDNREPGRVPFRFSPFGQDYPSIFLSLDPHETLESGLQYFKTFSKDATSFQFVDVDGDIFDIVGVDEWDYFMLESSNGANYGRYGQIVAVVE